VGDVVDVVGVVELVDVVDFVGVVPGALPCPYHSFTPPCPLQAPCFDAADV
jgi:hypothetical protein